MADKTVPRKEGPSQRIMRKNASVGATQGFDDTFRESFTAIGQREPYRLASGQTGSGRVDCLPGRKTAFERIQGEQQFHLCKYK